MIDLKIKRVHDITEQYTPENINKICGREEYIMTFFVNGFKYYFETILDFAEQEESFIFGFFYDESTLDNGKQERLDFERKEIICEVSNKKYLSVLNDLHYYKPESKSSTRSIIADKIRDYCLSGVYTDEDEFVNSKNLNDFKVAASMFGRICAKEIINRYDSIDFSLRKYQNK